MNITPARILNRNSNSYLFLLTSKLWFAPVAAKDTYPATLTLITPPPLTQTGRVGPKSNFMREFLVAGGWTLPPTPPPLLPPPRAESHITKKGKPPPSLCPIRSTGRRQFVHLGLALHNGQAGMATDVAGCKIQSEIPQFFGFLNSSDYWQL